LSGGDAPDERMNGSSSSLTRRRFLQAAGATGLGVAGTLLTGTGRGGSVARAATPAWNSAKLGVFTEPSHSENYFQAFKEFQSEIDRAAAIYRTYRSWGKPIFNSGIYSILDPSQDNYLPVPELYISFHAFTDKKGSKCISWAEIAQGGCYDGEIDSWAAELDQVLSMSPTGHVYVAFHHEMENEAGPVPSGCGQIGNNCGSASDFKAAYWYFRARIQDDLMSLNGWPPSAITWVVTYMGNTFRGMHGGPDTWWPSAADSSYISGVPDDHLVGVDLYNRYRCHNKPWYTFQYLSDGTKGPGPQTFAVDKGRNLFIGECGTVEGDECGGSLPHGTEKAEWFDDALELMKSWGNLEALCYSQVTGFSSGDYRIDSSPESLAAFKALANDPFFAE